jgi:hypothetical protein
VDCENVQRRTVEGAPGQAAGEDKAPPRLDAAALTSQRVGGRRRAVTMVATSSEPGIVQATGYLEAGGINDRLEPVRAEVRVGGGGVRLRLGLTRRQLRLIAGDLRRHRTPRVRLTVSSVDAAGNTSRVRHLTVLLRR